MEDDKSSASLVTPNEDTFRVLCESIKDYAILVLDPEEIVQTWNTGARMIKGYRADEILGQPFLRFYLPADMQAGKPHRLLAQAARDSRVTDEGWRVRKDGPRFWAFVVITALYYPNGTIKDQPLGCGLFTSNATRPFRYN